MQATHGVTVGQLEEDALFYLQSRGIAREVAQQMLVEGFVREVLVRGEHSVMTPKLLAEAQRGLLTLMEDKG